MQKTENKVIWILVVLFFISGFCALLYQIAWQRMLFAYLGIELSVVTVVISSFMLGLGGGGLLGGVIADKFPVKAIELFAAAEVGVGIFGFLSPVLFRVVGVNLLGENIFVVALFLFLLLLTPTALMGATLPILVTHATRCWQHVGKSTGSFYSANTLGAALGAVFTGFGAFNFLTLNWVVCCAACGNLIIGSSLFVFFIRKP
ncbi:fused MFS/spermidine synthase [Hydrogenophaga soli]